MRKTTKDLVIEDVLSRYGDVYNVSVMDFKPDVQDLVPYSIPEPGVLYSMDDEMDMAMSKQAFLDMCPLYTVRVSVDVGASTYVHGVQEWYTVDGTKVKYIELDCIHIPDIVGTREDVCSWVHSI